MAGLGLAPVSYGRWRRCPLGVRSRSLVTTGSTKPETRFDERHGTGPGAYERPSPRVRHGPGTPTAGRLQEAAVSLLDLSRWQFAITVMFHMTFPAITVGLSIFLCVLYGMYWRTG